MGIWACHLARGKAATRYQGLDSQRSTAAFSVLPFCISVQRVLSETFDHQRLAVSQLGAGGWAASSHDVPLFHVPSLGNLARNDTGLCVHTVSI